MKIIVETAPQPHVEKKVSKLAQLSGRCRNQVEKLWNKTVSVSETDFSPGRRLAILTAGLFACWGIITFRIAGLHFGEAKVMKNHLTRQQNATEIIRARPGDILDRNGQLLATSIDTQSLFIVPRKIADPHQFSQLLAPAVGVSPESVRSKIDKNQTKGFLWIERRLTPDIVKAIRTLQLDSGSYGFRGEYQRHYPNGSLGIHVLGLRDIDGVGHGGIEQAYQNYLAGQAGKRILVRDARNRVIHLYEDPQQAVVPGVAIQLTIDIAMQQLVEKQLDLIMEKWEPRGCCAILCDPKTGEVLANSSRPTFNPEDSTSFREDAWMNRSIAWDYEPGSTIKPLIVASAIQQKTITQDSTFHGHWGKYRMGKRLLHDTHEYGEMSLADVLIKSSNIGMAQIGEQMTNAGLYEALQRFGFGLRTGSGLPGELTGKVRSLSRWNLYSTGSIPMGQELTVTPLQMIAAHCVLANGGSYLQPKFVMKIDQKETETIQPGLQMQLMKPETCQWIVRDPMRRVMSEGTGKRVNQTGYDLFGKTGTSQLYDPEIGRYSKTKTVCSFVCGLPAQNPQLLVLVVVDQPTKGTSHYGGTVAGPAAVTILKQTLPLLNPRFAKNNATRSRR